MRIEFIHAKKAEHSVTALCRVLGVSKSGYYAWARRPESTRSRDDRLLGAKVRASHEGSRGTYGVPRIHADLKEEGFDVGRKRIARLMQEQGLTGQRKKAFRRTTNSDHLFTIAPNVLERRFEVDEPNRAWVTDITYVRTWQGWLYLAVIIDLFSRRVVGWAAGEHMRTELVVDALSMALGRRCPGPGLLHHSDRGSQYASYQYRRELSARGIVCSMSRRADCWDNAVAESFFATLKKDLIHRHSWPTTAAARNAIAEYIEMFYNVRRRHSANGMVSPAEFERRHHGLRAAQAA